MRLLTHNLLACNVKGCDQNNFPLLIQVDKSQIIECEFKKDQLIKLISKLDWDALYKTVTYLGNTSLEKEVTQELLQDETFLKNMHRILMETHIQEGKLICQNCKRAYPIQNGIPNMILTENEI